MVKRDLPAVWSDYDEMIEDFERRFKNMLRGYGFAWWEPESRQLMPISPGAGITVDVREHEDEVIVVADLPGAAKEEIHVNLVNPRTLLVSIEEKKERELVESFTK